MKILHVINSLARGGGAEAFVLALATALNKIEGNVVHVLSLENPKDKEYIQLLEAEGVQCFALSHQMRSFRNIQLLSDFIQNHDYDIVNVHLFPSLYVVALTQRLKKMNVRLVYTEHSTTNRRRKKIWRAVEKKIYDTYDCIVSISAEVEQALKEHIHNVHSVVINNGINVSFFEKAVPIDICKEMGVTSDSKFVAMVARFSYMKDYKTLIRALLRLDNNVHLLCIGDGPFLSDNEDYACAMGIGSRVHFLGLRKDVPNLLQGSDVIVLSSEHEGFSISMLEAMSCKKPFIGSNVPGIGDLVRDVALLFEFQDDEGLALCINKVLGDKELYQNVAKRCHSFAKQYDINVVAQKYMCLYKSL